MNKNINLEHMLKIIEAIQGPPRRALVGKEYEHTMTLLRMIEPVRSSNNQRTWTDEYLLNGKEYHVTYGLEDQPLIEVFGEKEINE